MSLEVHSVMTIGVATIRPDATLQQAAARMKALDAGALVVCDEADVVGILTDRDIAIRAVAAGRHPESTTVRDAMTPRVVSCRFYENLGEAVGRMRKFAIRRIPVVADDGRPMGMITLRDLIRRGRPWLASTLLRSLSGPARASHAVRSPVAAPHYASGRFTTESAGASG
jgi:CBS domain-containing protein